MTIAAIYLICLFIAHGVMYALMGANNQSNS